MQGTTMKNQWRRTEDGYLVCDEFGYDISPDRQRNHQELVDHMAGKTWCDLSQLVEALNGYSVISMND